MCVMPQLISRNKYIYSVEDEFNGVVIKGTLLRQAVHVRTRCRRLHGLGRAERHHRLPLRLQVRYKKRNDSQLPEFTNDHCFRVYYRYSSDEDLALIPFESISERYSSEKAAKYVVGRISLGAPACRAGGAAPPQCLHCRISQRLIHAPQAQHRTAGRSRHGSPAVRSAQSLSRCPISEHAATALGNGRRRRTDHPSRKPSGNRLNNAIPDLFSAAKLRRRAAGIWPCFRNFITFTHTKQGKGITI